MSERYLTKGTVLEEPLGENLPQNRIEELNVICDFARIKYVFKASKEKQKPKRKKSQG